MNIQFTSVPLKEENRQALETPVHFKYRGNNLKGPCSHCVSKNEFEIHVYDLKKGLFKIYGFSTKVHFCCSKSM